MDGEQGAPPNDPAANVAADNRKRSKKAQMQSSTGGGSSAGKPSQHTGMPAPKDSIPSTRGLFGFRFGSKEKDVTATSVTKTGHSSGSRVPESLRGRGVRRRGAPAGHAIDDSVVHADSIFRKLFINDMNFMRSCVVIKTNDAGFVVIFFYDFPIRAPSDIT